MKALLVLIGFVAITLAQTQCDPNMLIPTATAFGNGWDSQKMEFLDLPVLAWTCNNGKKFSPPSHPEIVWQVPDQVMFDAASEQQENIVISISKSFHEELSQRSLDFSFTIGIPFQVGSLSFKYGLEWEKIHQEMTENDRYAGFSFHYWKTMTGEAYPDFIQSLDPIFQEGLDLCPTTISSFDDLSHYMDIVSYYGTHRAIQSSFGGLYHLYSFADQSLVQTHDETWLSQQFSLSFHFTAFDISPGLFVNISQITQEMDTQYVADSTTDEYYRGGDPGLQNNETIVQWTATIAAMPAPLNTTFVYIYRLIKDPQKQAIMKQLVNFYEQYGCLPTDTVWTPCKAPSKGAKAQPAKPIHHLKYGINKPLNN